MAPKSNSHVASQVASTQQRNPCTWGMRFAVPLEGPNGEWHATMDDVRALVDYVHAVLDVKFPADEYYMSLLGKGKLTGKLPKAWAKNGLLGPVVILGCAKIRQPHIDALWKTVGPQSENPTVKKLAYMTTEIGREHTVGDCTDVLTEEIRGGTFYWFSNDFTGTQREHYDTLVQEHRAWAHLGAARYDPSTEISNAEKDIREMEEKHGAADPSEWNWGAYCADVFEADEAKRKYEDLSAKVAALKVLRDEWCHGHAPGRVDACPAAGANAVTLATTSGPEAVAVAASAMNAGGGGEGGSASSHEGLPSIEHRPLIEESSRSRSPRRQHGAQTAVRPDRRSQSKLRSMMMLPMFDGHDSRWGKGKALMKRLYDMPHNQAMSDEEFAACQKFIDETLMISNWPRDNFQRECEFLKMVRKSYKGSTELGQNVPWRILKAKYDRDNQAHGSHGSHGSNNQTRVVPAFKETNEKCYIAFFTIDTINHDNQDCQRTQETEWIEFTDAFVQSIA